MLFSLSLLVVPGLEIQSVFAQSSFKNGPTVELITELNAPAGSVPPGAMWVKINLAHCQAALYRGASPIKTYPVGVGRKGWETPVGDFHVFQMVRNPKWKHPLTEKIFKSGDPGNALGNYWIGFWTDGDMSIGFHGTPQRHSVGQASSHGCIRMHDRDVQELFSLVEIGTLVAVTR